MTTVVALKPPIPSSMDQCPRTPTRSPSKPSTSPMTPISPRTWPNDNILDDLARWEMEEERQAMMEEEMEYEYYQQQQQQQYEKQQEKLQQKENRSLSRLFRVLGSPSKTTRQLPIAPAPASSAPSTPKLSPHHEHHGSFALSTGSMLITQDTPSITPMVAITTPTMSPLRSLTSTPQLSPRASPRGSPRGSPSASPISTPRTPLRSTTPSGRPPTTPRAPTPRRAILKSPRMYLDEIHYLQHHPPSWMVNAQKDYDVLDGYTPTHRESTAQLSYKSKHIRALSSTPASPTNPRPASSSHSKTPPPQRSNLSSRATIRMIPTGISPMCLPRQIHSHQPSPIPSTTPIPSQSTTTPNNIPAPSHHREKSSGTPKLPPAPAVRDTSAPSLPPLPNNPTSAPPVPPTSTSTSAPPLPNWTRHELPSAGLSLPAVSEALPELKQVYGDKTLSMMQNEAATQIPKPVEKPVVQPRTRPSPAAVAGSIRDTIAAINRAAKSS